MTSPPTSVATATFRILGVDINCHILTTGQRVVEGDSMQRFFSAMRQADALDIRREAEEIARFERWQRGEYS